MNKLMPSLDISASRYHTWNLRMSCFIARCFLQKETEGKNWERSYRHYNPSCKSECVLIQSSVWNIDISLIFIRQVNIVRLLISVLTIFFWCLFTIGSTVFCLYCARCIILEVWYTYLVYFVTLMKVILL